MSGTIDMLFQGLSRGPSAKKRAMMRSESRVVFVPTFVLRLCVLLEPFVADVDIVRWFEGDA